MNVSQASSLALLQASQEPGAKAAKSTLEARKLERIDEAAKEFESVLIAEMIKPMFEGISTEAPYGGGKGEEIFRGLLIQEYGKMLAHNGGGIGLADQIKQQMIEIQEQTYNATTAQ